MKLKKGKLNKKLIYSTNKYKYDFQQYETIRSFGEGIYAGKNTIYEAEEGQRNLLKDILEFNEKLKPRTKEGNEKIKIFMKVDVLFMKD